jgi:hypothetical protein
MLVKLLGIQRKLDLLFNDGWFDDAWVGSGTTF